MRLSTQASKNWFRDFEEIRKNLSRQTIIKGQALDLNQIDTPEFIKQQERVSLYGFVFALRWFEDCNKSTEGGLPENLQKDLQRLCQSKDHDPKYLKKFLEAMHQHYMYRYGIDAKKSEGLMFYIRDIFMSGVDELDPIIEYQSVKLNVQGQKLRGDIGGNLPDDLPQGQALLNHLSSALNVIVKKNQIELEDTHYKGRQLPPSFTRADKGMKSPAFSNDPDEIIPVATRRVNFDNGLCAIQTLAASPADESEEVVRKRFQASSEVFPLEEERFGFLFQFGVEKPQMKLMMRLLNPSVLQTFLGGNPDDKMVKFERQTSKDLGFKYKVMPLATQRFLTQRTSEDVEGIATEFIVYLNGVKSFLETKEAGDKYESTQVDQSSQNHLENLITHIKLNKRLPLSDQNRINHLCHQLIASQGDIQRQQVGFLLKLILELHLSDCSYDHKFIQLDAYLSQYVQSNRLAKVGLGLGVLISIIMIPILGINLLTLSSALFYSVMSGLLILKSNKSKYVFLMIGTIAFVSSALSLNTVAMPSMLIIAAPFLFSFLAYGGLRLILNLSMGLFQILFRNPNQHYDLYRAALVSSAYGMTGQSISGCKSARDREGLLIRAQTILLNQIKSDATKPLIKVLGSELMGSEIQNLSTFIDSKAPLSRPIQTLPQMLGEKLFQGVYGWVFKLFLSITVGISFGLLMPMNSGLLIGLISGGVTFLLSFLSARLACVKSHKTILMGVRYQDLCSFVLSLGVMVGAAYSLPFLGSIYSPFGMNGPIPVVLIVIASTLVFLNYCMTRCSPGALSGAERFSKKKKQYIKPGKLFQTKSTLKSTLSSSALIIAMSISLNVMIVIMTSGVMPLDLMISVQNVMAMQAIVPASIASLLIIAVLFKLNNFKYFKYPLVVLLGAHVGLGLGILSSMLQFSLESFSILMTALNTFDPVWGGLLIGLVVSGLWVIANLILDRVSSKSQTLDELREEIEASILKLRPKLLKLMADPTANNINKIRALIEQNPLLVNEKDSNGQTALMFAAGNGEVDMVKALLEAGSLVDQPDSNGQTALMFAAGNGEVDMVKALLEAGALVDQTDLTGQTALGIATSNQDARVIEVLRQEEVLLTDLSSLDKLSDLLLSGTFEAYQGVVGSQELKIKDMDGARLDDSGNKTSDENIPRSHCGP